LSFYHDRGGCVASEETRIRVLFVDSSEDYVHEARRFLEKHEPEKFEVIWHKVGEEAIDFLRENKEGIDIVLTDYFLPIADGLEITGLIREISAQIPVIFITSSKELKVAVEAMKIGADDYLVKEETGMEILARTIINTLTRAKLKEQMEKIKKRTLMAEKQTDAIKALIVTICHEFNNPLAAIKISIDVLQRQTLSDDEKQYIQKLETHVKAIENKINRLRDINFEALDYSTL
jgi:DNA-binding response OmpR family regulator